MTAPEPVIGVLLAGGQSRRMGGGDKCLLPLAGKPLLQHVIERLAPQVGAIVLNANGDASRFVAFGLAVVPDPIEGFAGPLAGVLAGMRWAGANHPEARWIVTAATDTPFFPDDLVARLLAATNRKYPAIALAESQGRQHPVFGLWPTALADDLDTALRSGTRKVLDWTDRHPTVTAVFGPVEIAGCSIDPFYNANRPDELAQAEAMLADRTADHPLRGRPDAKRPGEGSGRTDRSLRSPRPSPPPQGARENKERATPIFGVVGWKKSGKTTLVAKLIGEFTRRGYIVAAMKHAHHAFDIDHPGRDSHTFREAGARQVAIGSSRRWALMTELAKGEPEPAFADLLAHLGPCDLVLVEGWKGAPFPKIEARSSRTLTREPLAKDDPHIVAVASDDGADAGALPVFGLDDVAAIADFIQGHLGLEGPARRA